MSEKWNGLLDALLMLLFSFALCLAMLVLVVALVPLVVAGAMLLFYAILIYIASKVSLACKHVYAVAKKVLSRNMDPVHK